MTSTPRPAATAGELSHSLDAIIAGLARRVDAVSPVRPGDRDGAVAIARVASAGTPYAAEWLAGEGAAVPGADDRTRAAFLIGRLSWTLAGFCAGASLTGVSLPLFGPEDVFIAPERFTWHYQGQSGEAIRYRLSVAGAPETAAGDTGRIETIRKSLEAVHAPLIDAVAARTGLSRGAQWRIVADSVAGAFLHVGNQLGCAELAMERGQAILAAPNSPLRNRKTGYVRVELPDPAGAERVLFADWYCSRGGCCRYYSVPGGSFCATCVLRKPRDRDALLRADLERRYLLEAP